VAALSVPEQYGGVGATTFETHIVLEELGRLLTPTPLFPSAVMTTGALTRLADDDARDRLLPALTEGNSIGALGTDRSRLQADAVSEVWSLSGSTGPVLGGDAADVLLVLAPVENRTGLFEVDLEHAGVSRSASAGLDQTIRFGEFVFDHASTSLLGVAEEEDVQNLLSVIKVSNTALQVGAAREAFERTVAYLQERVQFGRPLGSFQALKHRCADMMVSVESARSISWAAAWTAATGGPGLRTQAAIASSWCSEAFSKVASETVQMHGGIAITWEHDAHLYFKRAHASSQLFGPPHEARRPLVR
jgi:alkylation response protein AidB-like acyl-CoA dehydrogenase